MLKINILGAGCTRCETLERITRMAVEEIHIDAVVEKVSDIQEILKYSVMQTPALIINEEVVLVGEVPGLARLKEILEKYNSQ